MTAAMMVGYGPIGFQLEMTGPNGPVRATLGVGPAGPVLSTLGPFNTVSAGAAGSGRLVDVPTAQFLALPNGTLAWVQSVQALYFRYTSPTAISSDGLNILKPLGGVSREVWLRIDAPTPYWQGRSAWFIDPAGGSDEALGNTIGAPLHTYAELVRRCGYGVGPQVGCTITILNSVPSSDVVDLGLFGSFPTAPFTLVGQTTNITPVGAGVLTGASVARAPATNTPNKFTDANIANWNTFASAGCVVHFTTIGGVARSAYAMVVKDLGAHQGEFGTVFDVFGTFSEVHPVIGDTYEILSFPSVGAMSAGAVGDRGSTLGGVFSNINFLRFTGAAGDVLSNTSGDWLEYNCCQFDNVDIVGGSMAAAVCNWNTQCVILSAVLEDFASVWKNVGSVGLLGGSNVQFSNGSLFSESTLLIDRGSVPNFIDCALFDWTAGQDAITIRAGAAARFQTIWGVSAGAGRGLRVQPSAQGASIGNAALGTLAGATGQVIVNATAKTWADFTAGYVDAASGAKITLT